MDLKKYSNTQILQMLGLRFKDYRLMMNLSQGELAKAAGVSVSTVHKFETGTITNMNVTNLMALLRPVGLACWTGSTTSFRSSPRIHI